MEAARANATVCHGSCCTLRASHTHGSSVTLSGQRMKTLFAFLLLCSVSFAARDTPMKPVRVREIVSTYSFAAVAKFSNTLPGVSSSGKITGSALPGA